MKTALPEPVIDAEKSDASPGVMALLAFSLVAIVGLCLMVGALVYRQRAGSGTIDSSLPVDGRFQYGVDEQTGIARDWPEQDRLVHEHLDTYGWVDRAGGIVHIPIERAMDLLLTEQKLRGAASPPTQAAR
jgi:hypothetical protein